MGEKMKRFIRITDVKVQDRQRKEFPEGANVELQASITDIGLLNPIVLETIPVGDGTQDFILRAGERRLRAVSDIYALGGRFQFDGDLVPDGCIPYTLFSQLTERQRLQIEVDENEQRQEFTWQERAKATAKLKKLRDLEAEERGEEKPTVAEISKEVRGSAIGDYQTQTKRELVVAAHLDNPEVQKASSVNEAYKILKKQEARKQAEALGESVGAVFSSNVHQLHNTDSLGWMFECGNELFDVILTDPPYGMGADTFGDAGGKADGAHFYQDDYEYWLKIMSVFPKETYRIAKPNAHMYCFCDVDRFGELKKLLADAGWNVFRTPLIWVKPNAYRAPWPEKGPQRRYEFILFAIKGDLGVTKMLGDVLTYPADDNLGHPAQKPVALYRDLLSRSTLPGMKVFDPFCGTGPIFPAAYERLCEATGIEGDTASYGIAARRILELK